MRDSPNTDPACDDAASALPAIRSTSSLIEATFLKAGQALEASIEILAKMTAGSEAVLDSLGGENLNEALTALSRTADRINQLARDQGKESARFLGMREQTEAIGRRVGQMKASLKYVDALAMNARIAAAGMDTTRVDFSSFADEISRTVDVAKRTLDRFTAESHAAGELVARAHAGQLRFETLQHEAAGSITRRLSATVASIATRHEYAARSHQQIQSGSVRVRQRIAEAIMALQIGDITRQRLEHAEIALGFTGDGLPPDQRPLFVAAARSVISAQLADAAGDFDRDVGRVAGSLNTLATEAEALRGLGCAARESAEHDGGDFMMELESQVGEALALLEGFETARAEVAGVAATVSETTASLCRHLRDVQALEDDIRIMGLNTTFKCARVGRDGLALSLIAQELRTYAAAFSKEAGGLMLEVETIAHTGRADAEQAAESTEPVRRSHATLRRMREILDVAVADLDRDSERVVRLLMETVADLEERDRIGGALRAGAETLNALSGPGQTNPADLPPAVLRMLETMATSYTMANERDVHERCLGRTKPAAEPAMAATEPDDFLF
jgi:hypothetical protein